MSEIDRIKDQLERAHRGDAWHGPSLREVLEGVTAAQAAARPVSQAHTIWELVRHIIAWEQIARRRLSGETLVGIPDEMSFPPVLDTSDAAWHRVRAEVEESSRSLHDALQRMNDARLEATVPGTQYTNYVLLHGVIQHDLYHAGQIALLRKALV